MIDKKNPTIIQMVVVLLLIAVICSAGVAAIYDATKDTIQQQKDEKEQASLKLVLPEHDNDPVKDAVSISLNGKTYQCYVAKKGGQPVGYAVKAGNMNGYNGHVEVLTGFLPDGTIINSQATVLAETPGLGQKAIEPKYHDQFNGKNPSAFRLTVKKDGGDVDAISAATITSRAYAHAVQTAYDALMTHLGKSVEAHSGATGTNQNANEGAIDKDK
jgi:electron transport complex protein RnfG